MSLFRLNEAEYHSINTLTKEELQRIANKHPEIMNKKLSFYTRNFDKDGNQQHATIGSFLADKISEKDKAEFNFVSTNHSRQIKKDENIKTKGYLDPVNASIYDSLKIQKQSGDKLSKKDEKLMNTSRNKMLKNITKNRYDFDVKTDNFLDRGDREQQGHIKTMNGQKHYSNSLTHIAKTASPRALENMNKRNTQIIQNIHSKK